MAGYVIGSDKGKSIVNNLKPGQTYKASDGSTWKKNKDGSVSVTTKQGGYTANALSGSGGSSGGGSGKSSSSSPKLTAFDEWAKSHPDLVSDTITVRNGQDYHYENGVLTPGGDNKTHYAGNEDWGSLPPYGSNADASSMFANDFYNSALENLKNQQAAQEAAIRKQTQATIDNINSNIPGINQNFEDQQRANYINYTKNQFGLSDYLKSMGYSGGMSETEGTRLAANYQNARNQTDQGKNDAIRNIQNLVAQAQATGDTNLAQAASDYYNQYVAIAQQQAQAQAEQERWQKQYDAQQAQAAQDNYLSTIGAYSNDYQAEINRLLSLGYSPDSFEIKGLQQARNEKLQALAEQQAKDKQQAFDNSVVLKRLNYDINRPYYNPNSGRGGSSTEKYNGFTASQALSAYNSGIYTAAVMDAMKHFYGYTERIRGGSIWPIPKNRSRKY